MGKEPKKPRKPRTPRKPTAGRRLSPTEEALRIIEEYADDLRAFIRKIRQRLH